MAQYKPKVERKSKIALHGARGGTFLKAKGVGKWGFSASDRLTELIEDCSLGMEVTSLVGDLGAGPIAAARLTLRWKESGTPTTDVTAGKTPCSMLQVTLHTLHTRPPRADEDVHPPGQCILRSFGSAVIGRKSWGNGSGCRETSPQSGSGLSLASALKWLTPDPTWANLA